MHFRTKNSCKPNFKCWVNWMRLKTALSCPPLPPGLPKQRNKRGSYNIRRHLACNNLSVRLEKISKINTLNLTGLVYCKSARFFYNKGKIRRLIVFCMISFRSHRFDNYFNCLLKLLMKLPTVGYTISKRWDKIYRGIGIK